MDKQKKDGEKKRTSNQNSTFHSLTSLMHGFLNEKN